MATVKTAMYFLICLDPGNAIPILYYDISIARLRAIMSDKINFLFLQSRGKHT